MQGDNKSELVRFLEITDEVAKESLACHAAALQYLSEVDVLFDEARHHYGSIKPACASVLLLNAHASFRAAIGLALRGQLLPVFMALRGAIESALYSNAMVSRPELESIWLKRDKDKAARQKCRDEFGLGIVLKYLAARHDQGYADSIREAYDSTIDFGAHPNSRMIIGSTHLEELADGSHALDFAYVHGPGSFELRQSLFACFEVGLHLFFIVLITGQEVEKIYALNDRALVLQGRINELEKVLAPST